MNRIDELIIRDKFTNPEQVAEVLKGEILPIARNFFLLSDDVVVRYRRDENNYIFNIEIKAGRIKPFGRLI